MTALPPSDAQGSLDLAGLGKLAKAIPAEVYKRTATSVTATFEALVSPITETTSGVGMLIRQKFAAMVEVQKAVAVYTLEEACARAAAKLEMKKSKLTPVAHPKSFVRAFEEAASETDPVLHEMWTNLLASQIAHDEMHPHFVELLTHFSAEEAQMLASLRTIDDVGENGGRYIMVNLDTNIRSWIKHATDIDPKPWTPSCCTVRSRASGPRTCSR